MWARVESAQRDQWTRALGFEAERLKSGFVDEQYVAFSMNVSSGVPSASTHWSWLEGGDGLRRTETAGVDAGSLGWVAKAYM